MEQLIDLADIAARSGFSPRRLRYVFDHELVPGIEQKASGRGIPRQVTMHQALGIALAATLMEAGMTREIVADCVDMLFLPTVKCSPRWAYDREMIKSRPYWLEVADGDYVRLVPQPTYPGQDSTEIPWLPLQGRARLATSFAPIAVLRVDLFAIQNRLKG